jgi:hypothetical protein
VLFVGGEILFVGCLSSKEHCITSLNLWWSRYFRYAKTTYISIFRKLLIYFTFAHKKRRWRKYFAKTSTLILLFIKVLGVLFFCKSISGQWSVQQWPQAPSIEAKATGLNGSDELCERRNP